MVQTHKIPEEKGSNLSGAMSVDSGGSLTWDELFAPWVRVGLPVAERKGLGAQKVLMIPQ